MGKKDVLGRSLIKNKRFNDKRKPNASAQHTTDLGDGYDWARLNLKSITEQSTLEDFLSTAELAGTEFIAERQNIKIVGPTAVNGLLTTDEKHLIEEAQNKNRELLSIPRRPQWDCTTTPEELALREKDSFLNWRRQLAKLQETEHILLTPFEKNLEFWRQLWRVIERSDIVVQIVDARNPKLFRCEDLERYVKEVDSKKTNVLLLNKSDFLTQEQRVQWAKYFDQIGVRVVFFSALQQSDAARSSLSANDSEKSSEKDEIDNEENTDDEESDESEDEGITVEPEVESSLAEDNVKDDDAAQSKVEEAGEVVASSEETNTSSQNQLDENLETSQPSEEQSYGVNNSPSLLSREELLEFFKSFHGRRDGTTVVGLVGYPNVGKSSTINSLVQCKKVSVSATPGKTKHFQTIIIDPELCLCDCPGLVFPNFVSTKAEMIINGILPIDEMTDHIPPVTLITENIPRHILEETYGIMLPEPHEAESATRKPTAEELLNAYGYTRGFMTQRGLPDTARSARYILKDYVNGKLLFCHAPPNACQSSYHRFPERKRDVSQHNAHIPNQQKRILKADRPSSHEFDKTFFRQAHSQAHTKGIHGVTGYTRKADFVRHSGEIEKGLSDMSISGKPWKKHNNRNKKEKLRRIYKELDN